MTLYRLVITMGGLARDSGCREMTILYHSILLVPYNKTVMKSVRVRTQTVATVTDYH